MAQKKQPSVVLIPARFQQPVTPLLACSPLPYLLGSHWRQRMLHDFVAASTGISIDSKLALDEYLAVEGTAQIGKFGPAVTEAALALRGKFSIPGMFHAEAQLGLSQAGGVAAELLARRTLAKNFVSDLYLRNDHLGIRFVGQNAVVGFETEISGTSGNLRVEPNLAYALVKHGRFGFGTEISDKTFRLETVLGSARPGDFAVSLALNSAGRVTLGFQQALVTRRRVVNPIEDSRVRFIANFVDTAVEAVHDSVAKTTDFTASIAYQPNKNVLVKSRLSSTHGIAGAVAFKFWGVPTLAVSVTGGFRPGNTEVSTRNFWCSLGAYVGLQIAVQNHGETQFPTFTDFETRAPGGFRWEPLREEESDERLPTKGRYAQSPEVEAEPSLLF